MGGVQPKVSLRRETPKRMSFSQWARRTLTMLRLRRAASFKLIQAERLNEFQWKDNASSWLADSVVMNLSAADCQYVHWTLFSKFWSESRFLLSSPEFALLTRCWLQCREPLTAFVVLATFNGLNIKVWVRILPTLPIRRLLAHKAQLITLPTVLQSL